MQKQPETGFTLIELLVAVAITAILSLLLASAYSSLMVGGMRANTTVDVQNNARLALSLIASDVSSGGFLMCGPSGLGGYEVLIYNSGVTANNGVTALYPAIATVQTAAGTVPGTNTAFGYTSSAPVATDALTLVYNNTYGNQDLLGGNGVRIINVVNGTTNSADLKVASSQGLNAGDIDMLVLPTLNACIRLQITNLNGTNNTNVIHNSGQSNINPPSGFSTFDPLLPNPITVADLQQSTLHDMGAPNRSDGLLQVTYSIRLFNGTPTLYRTVVNSLGQITEDAGIADNVVYLRALFAPLVNGTLGAYTDWPTITGNGQQNQVGAVQFAVLLRKQNIGNRNDVPATITVLDVNYPTNTQFEYQLYTRTIFLRNVAWSQ